VAAGSVMHDSQAYCVALTLFHACVDVWYPRVLKQQPNILPTPLDACRQRQPGH
jgi:hypothetical protein